MKGILKLTFQYRIQLQDHCSKDYLEALQLKLFRIISLFFSMLYIKVVQCKWEQSSDAIRILPNPFWRFDFINDLIKIKSGLTFFWDWMFTPHFSLKVLDPSKGYFTNTVYHPIPGPLYFHLRLLVLLQVSSKIHFIHSVILNYKLWQYSVTGLGPQER